MPFCELQNISVFRTEIKLEMTPSDIPKVDFATALNQNFIGVCTITRKSLVVGFRPAKSYLGDATIHSDDQNTSSSFP
jgi:hypothetical protein